MTRSPLSTSRSRNHFPGGGTQFGIVFPTRAAAGKFADLARQRPYSHKPPDDEGATLRVAPPRTPETKQKGILASKVNAELDRDSYQGIVRTNHLRIDPPKTTISIVMSSGQLIELAAIGYEGDGPGLCVCASIGLTCATTPTLIWRPSAGSRRPPASAHETPPSCRRHCVVKCPQPIDRPRQTTTPMVSTRRPELLSRHTLRLATWNIASLLGTLATTGPRQTRNRNFLDDLLSSHHRKRGAQRATCPLPHTHTPAHAWLRHRPRRPQREAPSSP